jgi:hypothetical protein
MPNRTAKLISAIFVNILAGVPLATMARGETANAEDCLSSPKAETPPGSHWRYRIDHANKRNCWYLRQEGGGLSQNLPQSSPPAPPPAAKPSIADARAELRSRPGHEDNSVVPPPANPVANEANSANAPVWNTEPTVATRWPELPPAFERSKAAPATASPADNVTQAPADPSQAAAPAPSATLAYLSGPIEPETIPTLFAATVGALAFAGAAALISRRRRTRLRPRVTQSAQGPVWETTDDDRIILSDYHPSSDHRDYRPRFARGAAGAAVASAGRTPEFAPRASRYAQR